MEVVKVGGAKYLGHILELEVGCGVLGTCVLSRLQEEEVCKLDHILCRFDIFVGGGGCDGRNVAEALYWGSFDMVGRGFLIVLVPVLGLQVDFQRPLTI